MIQRVFCLGLFLCVSQISILGMDRSYKQLAQRDTKRNAAISLCKPKSFSRLPNSRTKAVKNHQGETLYDYTVIDKKSSFDKLIHYTHCDHQAGFSLVFQSLSLTDSIKQQQAMKFFGYNLPEDDDLFSAMQMYRGIRKGMIKSRDVDMYWAIMNSSTLGVRVLIKSGILVNDQEFSWGNPLFLSVARREYDIVRLLIDTGFDLFVTDSDGFTALYWAQEAHDTQMVVLLKNAMNKKKKIIG